ncbi:MAG: hypothetical protein P1U84_05060 [Parvibaculaceae bacterium]|nr:hypothetical protein [Parvibaculaceae bacterium]
MTAPSREEIDAKLAATEARIEASVSRMEGTLNAVVARLDARMDAIDARIGTLPTSGTMWAAAGTTIISILGVVLTVLAFGGDRFSSGLEFGATFGQETAEIRQLVQQNSESIERLVNILEEQRTQPAPAQEPKE